MLAFLATRICSKTQNGKSDIGVQTSEILSHAQKCGTLDTCYPWTFKLRSHSTIALLKCSPHQEKALAIFWKTEIFWPRQRASTSIFGQHSKFMRQLHSNWKIPSLYFSKLPKFYTSYILSYTNVCSARSSLCHGVILYKSVWAKITIKQPVRRRGPPTSCIL